MFQNSRMKISQRRMNLMNAVVAQAAWWICVLSAKNSPAIIPMLAAAFVLLIHFAIGTNNWKRDIIIVTLFTFYGSVLDSFLIYKGIYILPSGSQWAPVWLTCLWCIYATNLEYSLKWISNRPLVGALLGAIFGPISYAAGSTFGILVFREPKWQTVAISSVMWAISTPFVYGILKRTR